MATIQDRQQDFRFRVSWDGEPVPFISKVNALDRDTDVVEERDGGGDATHKAPQGRPTTRHESRNAARVYGVRRCWPSRYQAFEGLDAGNSGLAIETLRLENEGWERVS